MFEEVLKKAIYHTFSIAAQLRLVGHHVLSYPPGTEFEGQTKESIHEEHGGRFLWTMFPGIRKTVDGRPEIIWKATVICEVPAPHREGLQDIVIQLKTKGGAEVMTAHHQLL